MTRSIIGFTLLIVLLLGGVFVQNEMNVVQRPVARMLDVSAQSSMEADWESAESLFRSAARRWQQKWRFSAALADHEPMEEIDGLFARLDVYCQERDTMEFASACRELSRRIDAMADAHAFNWWNLL